MSSNKYLLKVITNFGERVFITTADSKTDAKQSALNSGCESIDTDQCTITMDIDVFNGIVESFTYLVNEINEEIELPFNSPREWQQILDRATKNFNDIGFSMSKITKH